MIRKYRGFTVGKLLLVILAFLIIGTSISAFISCSEVDKGAAEKSAQEWVTSMGVENARINCTGKDSNNDGYVSCTVGYKDEKGLLHTQPLECAAKFTFNSGCRIPNVVRR